MSQECVGSCTSQMIPVVRDFCDGDGYEWSLWQCECCDRWALRPEGCAPRPAGLRSVIRLTPDINE